MKYFGPVSLAVLVYAGSIKSNSAVAWIPGDLTFIAAACVALAVAGARIGGQHATGRLAIPLLLWTAFITGIFAASLEGYSATKVYTLFTLTLLCAVAPFYLLAQQRQRYTFLVALLVGTTVTAVQRLFFTTVAADADTNRLSFVNTNTIITAQLAGTGALVAILCAVFVPLALRHRVALFGIAAMLLYTLLASGSRGPFGGFVLALIVSVVFLPGFKKYRGRAIVIGGLLVGFAIRQAVQNGSDGATRILEALATGGRDENRAGLWQAAVTQINSHPLGVGWGGFDSFSPYPHNIFLEVAIETGWIVGAIFVSLLALAVVKLRAAATTPDIGILFALLIFALFNAMVSSDINGDRLMWVAAGVGWATLSPLAAHRPKPVFLADSAGV